MAVKEGRWTDGAKILYQGRTYRPAGAKDLCGTCWEARDHFERARRMRIRSFLIANLGVGVGAKPVKGIQVGFDVGALHTGGPNITGTGDLASDIGDTFGFGRVLPNFQLSVSYGF